MFEHPLEYFTVATGAAANALALAHLCPNFGQIICDQFSHIVVNEAAAPEFFCGGARLHGVRTAGKVTLQGLEEAIENAQAMGVHGTRPHVISVTQPTERGLIYRAHELERISAFAKENHLAVHMDGARFANAVAALGVAPADLTWRVGVDVLCLGGTKNGCLAAEMIIFFDKQKAEEFNSRRKQAGQLFSKSRFFAAQFLAYFKEGLWLQNAAHANASAQHFAQGVERLKAKDISVPYPVETNQVFVTLPKDLVDTLHGEGYAFFPWAPYSDPPQDHLYRFIMSYNSREEDIAACLKTISRYFEKRV